MSEIYISSESTPSLEASSASSDEPGSSSQEPGGKKPGGHTPHKKQVKPFPCSQDFCAQNGLENWESLRQPRLRHLPEHKRAAMEKLFGILGSGTNPSTALRKRAAEKLSDKAAAAFKEGYGRDVFSSALYAYRMFLKSSLRFSCFNRRIQIARLTLGFVEEAFLGKDIEFALACQHALANEFAPEDKRSTEFGARLKALDKKAREIASQRAENITTPAESSPIRLRKDHGLLMV